MENGMILDRSQTPSTSGGARTRSASHYSEPDEHGFQRQALEVPPSEIKQQSGCFGCQGRKNKNSPSRVNTKFFIFFFTFPPCPNPFFIRSPLIKKLKQKPFFSSTRTTTNCRLTRSATRPLTPTKSCLLSRPKRR